MEELDEVRRLWHGVAAGVLSTTSQAVAGYPFGSLVPYVSTPEGRPVIYISTIAQHTRNLVADPRACLTVLEPGLEDPQAGGRISLIGDARTLSDEERESIAQSYFERFPASRRFEDTHGFQFWILDPRRVRFIGGFGKIRWIEPEAWLQPAPK